MTRKGYPSDVNDAELKSLLIMIIKQGGRRHKERIVLILAFSE